MQRDTVEKNFVETRSKNCDFLEVERVLLDVSPRDKSNMVVKGLKAISLVSGCITGTKRASSDTEPDTQKFAA